MSGHGFHVHGPHDHELEHAQQGGHGGEHGGMINQIAMFTAIIATVGAMFSYMGGATQATTALQVAIALAAIALLTKKRWLEYGMFAVGGLGAAIGVAAMLHY